MISITLAYGLPFISVMVRADGKNLEITNVLVDTGSANTIFRTDDMEQLGILLALTDEIMFMRGVGGREPVVEKQVESVAVGDLIVSPLIIQIGALDYGFPINDILGFDFLMENLKGFCLIFGKGDLAGRPYIRHVLIGLSISQSGAQIDFKKMEIRKASS